jgi:hypothetical protein
MNNVTQNVILAEYAVKYVETIMSKKPGAFNRPESVVHQVLPGMPPYPPKPLQGPDRPPEQGMFASLGSLLFDSPWVADQKAKLAGEKQWVTALNDGVSAKRKEIEGKRDEQKARMLKVIGQGGDPAANAILVGSQVEQSGVGNCGEQSYVAFKYLVTKGAPGLAIVDWDEMARWKGKGDDKVPTGNHTFVVIGMDPTVPEVTEASLLIPPVWGENAVVCDPWYHEWFKVESLDDWQTRMKRILGETRNIRPDQPWLTKSIAETQGQTAAYAKTVMQNWNFKRLVYLPHRNPQLVQLACSIGNELRELRDMRASNFRGRAL